MFCRREGWVHLAALEPDLDFRIWAASEGLQIQKLNLRRGANSGAWDRWMDLFLPGAYLKLPLFAL